jgi:hypothetical protein
MKDWEGRRKRINRSATKLIPHRSETCDSARSHSHSLYKICSFRTVTFSLNTTLTILGLYWTPFEVTLMDSGKYYSLGYVRQSERVALFVLGYEPESMSDFGKFLLLFSVSPKLTRS